MSDKPLTPREAAEYLRCSESTLQKMRQQKTGPTYARVGHKVVYLKEDLEAYVQSQREVKES